MFSIIFPGQGSQNVGMAKEFYENFDYVRNYFSIADELLGKNLSKIILEGPKEDLDLTENTQPAIFLASYSIFKVIENETKFKISDAKFFAGHSLGEYSALCCANSINFQQTVYLLKKRGKAMQNAVPNGKGGMVAVLGIDINQINKILQENKNKFSCYIANDNTIGQLVVSGENVSLKLFCDILTLNKIKFIKLPVSAPFHCPLMNKATLEMKDEIYKTQFNIPLVDIISNVTANPVNDPDSIKKLLLQQIESPVRWKESIDNMISSGVKRFIEIGPGKVLSGLIKRIDRNVILNQVNNIDEIHKL